MDYVMKTYGRVDVQVHVFLTSVLVVHHNTNVLFLFLSKFAINPIYVIIGRSVFNKYCEGTATHGCYAIYMLLNKQIIYFTAIKPVYIIIFLEDHVYHLFKLK